MILFDSENLGGFHEDDERVVERDRFDCHCCCWRRVVVVV